MALTPRSSVEIIEAAYRPEASDSAWLGGIMAAARPAFDHGLGMVGYLGDPSQPIGRRLVAPMALGPVPSGWLGKLVGSARSAAAHRPAPQAQPVTTLSALLADLPAARANLDASLGRFGMRDFLGLVGRDPSGAEVFLGAPLPQATQLGRSQLSLWSRVAAHLAAGFRFRRERARKDLALESPLLDAEAVLDGRGRTLHAEGAAVTSRARQALRDAASAIDRASRELRGNDPEQAVDLWRALVAGRWSVTDCFDSDGRRFFVAHKNEPEARGPTALTARERQIVGYASLGHADKLIAYELGVSPSTVSTHLSQAAAKLGVSSRTALIQLCAAWARTRETV